MASILLIDDDPNILDGLKDILEDAGYDVRTASSAAEAKALVSAQPADLAIVDFNLPDMKGPELAMQLAVAPKPPVILLMTGLAVNDVPEGSSRAAIFEILTKPVDPAALLTLLQKALDARR